MTIALRASLTATRCWFEQTCETPGERPPISQHNEPANSPRSPGRASATSPRASANLTCAAGR